MTTKKTIDHIIFAKQKPKQSRYDHASSRLTSLLIKGVTVYHKPDATLMAAFMHA